MGKSIKDEVVDRFFNYGYMMNDRIMFGDYTIMKCDGDKYRVLSRHARKAKIDQSGLMVIDKGMCSIWGRAIPHFGRFVQEYFVEVTTTSNTIVYRRKSYLKPQQSVFDNSNCSDKLSALIPYYEEV